MLPNSNGIHTVRMTEVALMKVLRGFWRKENFDDKVAWKAVCILACA